ncbi:MAG: TolC family protein [Elusimicrobia bacterium]|nr:TolC family protein [Elusimicrobiota bacterium]
MTINKKFLLLPLVLLLAGPAAAQQQLTLTWDEARRLAVEHNPAVKAARASMEQAGYDYLAVSGLNYFIGYKPDLNVSRGLSGRGDITTKPAATTWNAGISVSETLLNFNTASGVKTSRIAKEKAVADYLDRSASARQTLAGAFVDLLFAQKRIEVQKKILNMRVENAKLIKLKYESGMESRGNALYTGALAENAAVSVKKAERQLTIAQRSLLQAIGLEGDISSVTAKGDISVPAFALDEARVNQALEKSPGIVSAKKTLEAAKERTNAAGNSAYPTLSASQSYGWSDVNDFPQRAGWSLGLRLDIPLFSGGPTTYFNKLSAAKKALAAAEENFKAERIALTTSLRSGYDDFLSASETALASVSLSKANDERYKEAQIKYMAGNISFIDLENVEQNFVDSDLNQLDLARAAYSRKLALEQQLGVGVEE